MFKHCREMAAFLFMLAIVFQTYQVHGLRQTHGGGQFITYEGTLGGYLTFADSDLKVCGDVGTFYFPRDGNTTMRIGVNPPAWDPNPFYFELIHEGVKTLDVPQPAATSITTRPRLTISTLRGLPTSHPNSAAFETRHLDSHLIKAQQRLQQERADPADRQLGCDGSEAGHCTSDSIFNLDFQSTFYGCFKNGKECESTPTAPFDSLAVQMLNLSRATTKVVDQRLTISDSGPYYNVYGDESTWASNRTSCLNSFDSRTRRNYSVMQIASCSDSRWPKMIWNNTTPFSYTLNFTNTTTLATFVITAPSFGTFTIAFEGVRVDDDGGHEPALEEDGETGIRYTPISLSSPTDHPNGPHFTFANGTEFHFDGTRVLANLTGKETMLTSLAPGWKQTPWMGGSTGAFWVGGCLLALGSAFLLC